MDIEGKAGSIEVICGCMFAGKTEELVRRIRRMEYAKKSVIIFKPVINIISPWFRFLVPFTLSLLTYVPNLLFKSVIVQLPLLKVSFACSSDTVGKLKIILHNWLLPIKISQAFFTSTWILFSS